MVFARCQVSFSSASNTCLNDHRDRLRESRIAYEKLAEFLKEQVTTRKSEIDAEKPLNDAFSMLINANQSEDGKYQLDDQEVVSCSQRMALRLRSQLFVRLGTCTFYYLLDTVRLYSQRLSALGLTTGSLVRNLRSYTRCNIGLSGTVR